MSDTESESSCVSALEDLSLGCTTPTEPNLKTTESYEFLYKDSRSNLSDGDQSKPPSISASTTQSYQDSTLPVEDDPLSSQEATRNRSPGTSKLSVSDFCEPIPELPYDADDNILKEPKDKLLVEEILPEHQKSDVESPTKNRDVESCKLEETKDESIVIERLAEQESSECSPTKMQKKDEPIHEEMLEEHSDDVESLSEAPQEDDAIVAKQQDDIESPKSEERLAEQETPEGSPTRRQKKDEPVDEEMLEERSDDVESSTEVQQEDDNIKSPKSKERLVEQETPEGSPTRKLKKDEPVDEEMLEERSDDVESSTEIEQEDGAIVVKSPQFEESVVKYKLEEHERDVTKKQTIDKEAVKSPKKEETWKERKENVVLPKPEEKIKCESVVKEDLTKHGSDVESSTEEQKKDEPIDTAVVTDRENGNLKSPKYGGEKPESSRKRTLLDKEYFEYVLKGFYKNNNIRVDECQGGVESSIQPSFMCEVKKFRLIGCKDNRKKFRLDVIVKALHSKEHQELYKSDITAKNEEIAYNTIFPNLTIYGNTILPVPICFFASDEQIIVQDLCGINYKTFDKKKGFITPKECIYTLKALAKFHAATFVLRYKYNDKLQNTKNILHCNMESPLLKHQHDCLENILSIHDSRKRSENNETEVKALEYLIKVAKSDIKDLLSKEQDDYVFCHGDLLLTNFLYKLNYKQKAKDDFEEIDIKFIDFQRVHFCSVASDLVYLLFINLKPEDYINNKADLLTRYFYYLKKNVIDCGVGDDFKLTYEWLLKEIDRFTEFGIIYALWILPMFGGDDNEDQSKEVTKEMLDDDSKKICYSQRMKRWVDYYSTIYKEKFEK